MNVQELNNIKLYIGQIEDFDIDQYIIDNFPDPPLENVMFGDYNSLEFKKIYKSVINRFKALIQSNMVLMLPTSYFPNGSGNNIIGVLRDLVSYISNKNNQGIFNGVRYIFEYCIQFGNWERNITYKPKISQKNIENLAGEIELIQKKLEQENNKLIHLIEEYSKSKNELDYKIIQTTEFYDTIKDKAKNANEYDTSIRSYLSSSEANKNTIETLKTNIATLEQKIAENIEDYKKRFDDVITQNERSLKLIKEADDLQKKILSQKQEVENLIGAAADGSLGTHFRERKNQIQNNVITFGVLAVVFFNLTCLLVFMIFKGFDINNSDWVHFVINILRTSPAWFLVWWLISRYSKERKLQEEYAFKSAIAMTMREHSKLLKATDSGELDKRDSQQIMLLKALDNIYSPPDTKQNKEGDNINPKNVEGFISKLTELIKEFRIRS
jgi:hypothetical protein